MSPKQDLYCAVGVGLFFAFITGCGSGSGNSGGSSPTPSFTLSLSPAAVTLTPGGATQTVQVSLAAQGGFTGAASVTVSGLSSGVTASPSPLSVSPGAPGTLTFSAAASTATSQASGSVHGVSGAISANVPFSVTVKSVPAVPFPFVSIGGYLVHGFYDAGRQLLFAANPELNELDVISSANLSVTARVPLPAA